MGNSSEGDEAHVDKELNKRLLQIKTALPRVELPEFPMPEVAMPKVKLPDIWGPYLAKQAAELNEIAKSALLPSVKTLQAINAEISSRFATEISRSMANVPIGAILSQARISSTSTKPRESRTPERFLLKHAEGITSVDELIGAISAIERRHRGHQLIWRGQQDVWPVQSSLRRSLGRGGAIPDEEALIKAERQILGVARSWGMSSLGAMQLFAILQHNGAPTRLLDVSPDPYVAAWFATEPNADLDEKPGLIIAWGRAPRVKARTFGIGNILEYESDAPEPEWFRYKGDEERMDRGWGTGTRTWHWAPDAYNERMRAQRGGFIVEATPLYDTTVEHIISEALGEDWRASEIARATSTLGVPSPTRRATKMNDRNVVPMFTLRVDPAAKRDIQEYLEARGLTQRAMYPDLPGLVTQLRSLYPTRAEHDDGP